MKTWLLVLAGGSGKRFWPCSRKKKPKQLLSILGKKSLLSNTLDRFCSFIAEENTLILSTKELHSSIQKELLGFSGKIFSEPEARNTAPAIVMAMEYIRSKEAKALVIVAPSDHWVDKPENYTETLKTAASLAKEEPFLFTIGVRPTRAATGYAYMTIGEPLEENIAFQVKSFVEKPALELAKTLWQKKNYFWNGGIFVWRVEVFFQELEKYAPSFLSAFAPYRDALKKGGSGEKEGKISHASCEKISIDYALMEKSQKLALVPANFEWKDLGSFDSLYDISPPCQGGAGQVKDSLSIDSSSNFIHSPQKTVALLGVQDLLIVETEDVLLVAKRKDSERVKELVSLLEEKEERKKLL